MAAKRKREPTFSASEKNALIELVEKYFHVVENKKTDSVSVKAKNEQWQTIATEFNSLSDLHPRDSISLRTCWENLKKRAKHLNTLRNQHHLGTGGGPPKKILDVPAIERVLEIIQTRVTGFINQFDSDGAHILAASSSTADAVVTAEEAGTSGVVAGSSTIEAAVDEVMLTSDHPINEREEEKHRLNMKILEIQLQSETEKLNQEKLKTEQEILKLEILKLELKILQQ